MKSPLHKQEIPYRTGGLLIGHAASINLQSVLWPLPSKTLKHVPNFNCINSPTETIPAYKLSMCLNALLDPCLSEMMGNNILFIHSAVLLNIHTLTSQLQKQMPLKRSS